MGVKEDTKVLIPQVKPRSGLTFFVVVGAILTALLILSAVWIIHTKKTETRYLVIFPNNQGLDEEREHIELKISIGGNYNEEKNRRGAPPTPSEEFPGKFITTESTNQQCSQIPDDLRFDCHPEENLTRSKCEARGCCWAKPQKETVKSQFSLGVPHCFYPTNYPSYYFVNATKKHDLITVFFARNTSSYYPNDIKLLRMDVTFTRYSARFKIYDPLNTRYEIPYPLREDKKSPIGQSKLDIEYNKHPFSIKVFHKDTNEILFDSSVGAFIYTDQFIQFSTKTNKFIYGLGERSENFLRSVDWQRHVLFTADHYPIPNANLYGSHPFMLQASGTGTASGIFLYNSNAMEIILQPAPAVTFRTVGGIIDLVIFSGPSPADVTRQYIQTIGLPTLPPFWSLGFHLSRYGLKSANETRQLWERNKNAGYPFDVQWNDIDYMEDRKDFTYDKKNYAELPELVDEIHKSGMRYVVILDPGMDTPKNPNSYPPYADGLKRKVFITDDHGKPIIGKVWSPNGAAFPDFTNPATTDFWTDQITEFNREIPVDGLWIDMNEPSNFFNGSKTGCPNSKYENPPYVPHVLGGKLNHLTMCMTGRQHAGLHYDLHNLYGYSETIATNKALRAIHPGKRPFIISRSTFAGQGHYGGHWTGDIFSNWDELKKSIPGILDFNLFGIPMVGADICGFNGNTTVKLCQRWMELGAFYPFSRNHNDIHGNDQDPAALGPDVLKATDYALVLRYTFLPYIYTQFYFAHVYGNTVARPLFFEFPHDEVTYPIDTQFLLGPGFMVLPALEEDVTEVKVYMPESRWYVVLNSNNVQVIDSTGEVMTFPSAPERIVVALRGGFIFPLKEPALTTTKLRENLFMLVVALDKDGNASGELFWDDGESLVENGNYNLITFMCKQNTLKSTVVKAGAIKELTKLGAIEIWGVSSPPNSVYVNGRIVKFNYDQNNQLVTVPLKLSLETPFSLTWT